MRPDLNWVGVLEHHAARTPDRPIAVFEGREVTYAEMVEWSARVAGGLAARGVQRGDVVALLSYNNVEMLTTIFAANHLGAVAMPINWRLAPPEVRFILEHSQAAALVCDAELADLATEATDGLGETAWLEKVVVRTRAMIDLERIREEASAVGHLARRLASMKDDPKELAELASVLADLDKKLPAELREGEGALRLADPALLRAMLDDVEQMLVPRLLEGGEA